MAEDEELKVVIEHGNTKTEFKGKYHEVWSSLNKYLSEIYPALPTVKKLVDAPDVEELSKILSGRVQFTEGKIVATGEEDAKKRIVLCLAAAKVGKTLGLFNEHSLSPQQISEYAGLGEDVARARLSELRKLGLVLKTDGGKYAYSPSGLRLIEKTRKRNG